MHRWQLLKSHFPKLLNMNTLPISVIINSLILSWRQTSFCYATNSSLVLTTLAPKSMNRTQPITPVISDSPFTTIVRQYHVELATFISLSLTALALLILILKRVRNLLESQLFQEYIHTQSEDRWKPYEEVNYQRLLKMSSTLPSAPLSEPSRVLQNMYLPPPSYYDTANSSTPFLPSTLTPKKLTKKEREGNKAKGAHLTTILG
nr:MAG: hypothetical protein [brine shrimp reovirus 1]UNI74317.1 MAG: hypothetical protein [brine shrimp reovirus 1]